MNIFDEIVRRNQGNLQKLCMSLCQEDGVTRAYTFEQLFAAATAFAEVLQGLGLSAGDRVAIASESSPEWSIAYLAIAKMRATAVLLDATLEKGDLMELLMKSDVRCLFASPMVQKKLGELPFAVLDILAAPAALRALPPAPPARLPGNPEVSSIIYSSGTTKKASGIMHSHDSLLNSALMCIDSNHLKGEDGFLAILPNSHIYGLVCQVIGPLLIGSSTRYLGALTGAALAQAFRECKPAIFPAVPKIYELLKTQILQKINSEAKTKTLFSIFFPICLKLRETTRLNLGKRLFGAVHENFGGNLRILCSAGAPMSPDTGAFFYGLGFDVLITYGATETCIPTIGNCAPEISTDSCGKPYPAVRVKISESGELLLKSPYLMLGYWDDEAATREAFDADGWFRSGDLAAQDARGNVRILGRCKENIVLSTGKKVAPDEVESAYADIAGVTELVVCGIPVAEGGYDEVHAFVVADAAQAEEVLARLRERSATLPLGQKLMGLHLVAEIPKTSLQKPKRFLLRQMLAQESEQPKAEEAAAVDVAGIVFEAVARFSHTAQEHFDRSTRLFLELPIDSLTALELACEIEERCGIRVEHLLRREMTIGELIDCADGDMTAAQPLPEEAYPKRKWRFAFNLFCFFRGLVRGIYHVDVENETNLPENSGYIICANHVSNFDYLFLTLNFKKERFTKFCCMAKKELFHKNWFSRGMANVCGMIPIDRSGIVAEAMSATREKLREKWGVLIHPEGTRSTDGQLGTFKNGAAVLAIEADVPVVPAYIKGGYEVFPCWRKCPLLFNWKKMCKYQVEVIYGEPILPGGHSADELMALVQDAVVHLAQMGRQKIGVS